MSTSEDTNRGAALFVWGTWSVMLLAALGYVWAFVKNVPWWDDWHVHIAVMTGTEPVTLSWLWMQMGESRMVLPKLVYLALVKLAGNDLRGVYYFNVLALAAIAFALIQVNRRLRGRTSYADAFFPLALLHWGHYELWIWATSVSLALVMLLTAAFLLIIVRYGRRLTPVATILAGTCLVLISQCGVYGLIYVPPPLLWFAYAGAVSWRSGQPRDRRVSLLVLAFVLATLFLVAGNFLGYEFSLAMDTSEESRSLLTVLDGSTKVLVMSVGPAGKLFWPFLGILIAGGLVLTAGLLVAAVWRELPAERLRVLGLLFFLSMFLYIAFGLGWRRPTEYSFLVGDKVPTWNIYYGTNFLLGLCCAYSAWGMYGPKSLRSFAQMGLFALMACMFSFNTSEALDVGRQRRDAFAEVERDLRAGVPLSKLVQRHVQLLLWAEPSIDFVEQSQVLHVAMQALHQGKFGAFRYLQLDPPSEETTLPLTSLGVYNMTWEDGIGEAAGNDSYVILALPQPAFVHGVRVKYSYPDGELPISPPKITWKAVAQDDFSGTEQYGTIASGAAPEEQLATMWVYDTIEQLQIPSNGKPCRISDIVFLMPVTDPQARADAHGR